MSTDVGRHSLAVGGSFQGLGPWATQTRVSAHPFILDVTTLLKAPTSVAALNDGL